MSLLRNRYRLFLTVVFAVAVSVFTIFAVAERNGDSFSAERDVIKTAGLKEVEPKYVCMVNDQLFMDEQIPVEVDGKIYYGCCEMCKGMLEKNEQARFSIDPLTGNKVDKAESVTAVGQTGRVMYFESRSSFEKYSKPN